MSNVAQFIGKPTLTMTSREISDLVESRHDNVKRTMETLRDKEIIRFTQSEETSHEGPGARPMAVYLVNKRDSYVVVAQLSPAFTARLVDRWQELEAREAQRTVEGGSNIFALAMVESMARTLRMSDSGVLLMYRQVAGVYAPEAVSAIPVYAIDAPKPASGAAESSMPTASLTVLLKEHGIKISAAQVNMLLASKGILEEMTRPSSKGEVKKFWSVTDAGLKYGKNVTSPSNTKETQPHWYRHSFAELARSYMALVVAPV